GFLYGKEIDFVALKHSQKLYIQVSENISNQETLKRELTPLKEIKDAYPKILLSRTLQPTYDIDGIQIIDIANWLRTTDSI
ncbi:MAG: ATPase, partial [Candidatus Riflebacteria bacterium]|nr:ATPase [Candidatus Riflebacteria bacterium]